MSNGADVERWITLLGLESIESFCLRSRFGLEAAELLYEGLSFFTAHREVAQAFLCFAAEATNQGHDARQIVLMILAGLKYEREPGHAAQN